MGQQRSISEFNGEAVRQMVERGHPVAEVAARLEATCCGSVPGSHRAGGHREESMN